MAIKLSNRLREILNANAATFYVEDRNGTVAFHDKVDDTSVWYRLTNGLWLLSYRGPPEWMNESWVTRTDRTGVSW